MKNYIYNFIDIYIYICNFINLIFNYIITMYFIKIFNIPCLPIIYSKFLLMYNIIAFYSASHVILFIEIHL